ncbi:MAG: hypothetical protein RDV48_26655 [Candidatus Eremiobacteraeota bacterium]|nr:hypothetical protein [Candidatus Eremiobacteraeota bacterium]
MKYTGITVITFILLQFIVVVMHEFAHSTAAWALGFMRSPCDIIWGNPLMLTGWDEGVDYSGLFSSGHFLAAAFIGGIPLAVHTVIVILGLILLQMKGIWNRKWLFHLLYWFVIANYMELIAYVTMRAFARHGDVGIFNRGLGLSPWIVFITGSFAVAGGLYVLFVKILPRMYVLFGEGNRLNQWMILLLTCFLLFIWGSGLRVVLYCYPDPQWMFGLLGFAAFGAVITACRHQGERSLDAVA